MAISRSLHPLICSIVTLIVIMSMFILFLCWNLPSPLPPLPPASSLIVDRHKTDFQIITSYGTTIILERLVLSQEISGIFFIAHACTHSAYDFWPQSPLCPDCIGLAEEVEIVRSALSQKFLVVAISSLDRKSGCWSAQDIEGVVSILKAIRRSLPSKRPIFGLGCSSGGRFLWQLSQHLFSTGDSYLHLDGMIIQAISIPIGISTIVPMYPPPIIFNPMTRDESMYKLILNNNRTLIDQHKYPPDYIKVQICNVRPLSPSFILSRLHYLNLTEMEAESIYSLLSTNGYVNHTGYFIKDPTDPLNKWREILSANLPSPTLSKLVLTLGRSPLAKVFNRCWAYHEYCADHIKENILWMKFVWHKQSSFIPQDTI